MQHCEPTAGGPLIVGIGGTTRTGSSSERALRYALEAAAELGARTLVCAATDLDLPMYRPEEPDRTSAATRLVEALRRADGVIIASPGYHGAVSGMIKNALDYTEDLRTDVRPYLDGRAVGCIATAAGWQAAISTLAQLRAITHALRGWPTPLGVAMNSALPCFDDTGTPTGQPADQLRAVAHQVVEFAHRRLPDRLAS
ncbi:FMN reductase [Saccharopolyspora kobensis]|uniref:FMN reductase n=1 Tax=Saccharopolyspora kobensis TaxID=146035 RepID=A0A1H5ZZR9_9PSEU|nr:FMN reductase [Saccharopolyspora kobensis]SFE16130.1 FMN reductase [Saccharopolyspora kobensis]